MTASAIVIAPQTAEYGDNGRGFAGGKTVEIGHGMGLTNLQNRIQSLGGSIAVQSTPANGMSARIEIPLSDGTL